jgi:type IV pilus assembly protein PilM
VVDWKKDIKLSDLVRRKKDAEPAAAPVEARDEQEPKKSRFARKAKAPKEQKQKRQRAPRAGRPVSVPRRGKKIVGLKVGASQLAAARVVNNGHPELLQLAREELEPGIVVGGELREPDALAEALKTFFRAHKLPRNGVRLGIASNRIGVRTFEISDIADEKQLHNAIRFRAQEALPIPLDEAVIDYQVLSERVDENGSRTRRVLLVVVYRDLVDRYVAACRKAGLKLVGIDLEAFGLLRALPDAPATDDARVVVCSLGHERTIVAVSAGETCEFTRVLEWGGLSLDVAVARALDVAPSEAEPVKRTLSLLEPAEAWTGLAAEQAVRAREALQRELETFSRELISSLQFYQGQPGSLGIGEIVLTGGTAHLPGLDVELGNLIGVRVNVGDPLARVRPGKRISGDEQLGSLAVAIGLGIEEH